MWKAGNSRPSTRSHRSTSQVRRLLYQWSEMAKLRRGLYTPSMSTLL